MKRATRIGRRFAAAITGIAALCVLTLLPTSASAVVISSGALGAAPDGGAGTGLRGQFFDSGGNVASIQTLLGASTAPNKVWNVSVIDYPNGGNHNVTSDALGLVNLLGVDAPSLTGGVVITNADNSRFAMRGYIEITAAMDLVPGGDINTMFRLDSDDDGNIVFNGGLNAVGTNLARNVTHAVDFTAPGFYQFDVLWQEGSGNTGATLRAQMADLNGGVLSIVPQSLLAPNLSQTPAPVPATLVPVDGVVGVGIDPGLAAQFFDSGGNLASIRTLLANNTAPNRTFVMTSPDYPNGGASNTASDAAGLFNLLGADAASVMGGGDIANVDNSRFAMRGFMRIDPAMDIDLNTAGIQIVLRMESDDDSNVVFNGGSNADGLNLGRNINHLLTFNTEGFYQVDIIWQEGGGSTKLYLQGQFANINNGALGLVPSNIFFQDFEPSVPEPASMALLSLGGLALLRRRRARA